MNEVLKEWYRLRTEAIHRTATAYDVLINHGVTLLQAGDSQEEQFSCPFHGADVKPSARVYPSDGDSHSHAWCFVCQEPGWDVIGLWKKFNGCTFGQALTGLERAYGLSTPELPKEILGQAISQVSPERGKFNKLYVSCENRLKEVKHLYVRWEDMRGFLSAGSVLDRVVTKVVGGSVSPEKGIEILRQVLDKIGAKVRQCPDG